MTDNIPHNHITYVDGCFRCDLSRDEAADASERECLGCGKPASEADDLTSMWWANYECCSMECTMRVESEKATAGEREPTSSDTITLTEDEQSRRRRADVFSSHVSVYTEYDVQVIVRDRVAAVEQRVTQARAEGAAQALRDAADELWGPSYTGGVQWGRSDYVHFLRARADRIEQRAAKTQAASDT